MSFPGEIPVPLTGLNTKMMRVLPLIFLGFCPSLLAVPVTNIVTSTANSGAGALRQALLNANTNTSATASNLIIFKLTGTAPFTISPASVLPSITSVLTIDATTESNYSGSPLIFLNGTNAGDGSYGLDLESSNCTVRGLAIGRFSGDGIHLGGSGSNTIQANFVGTTTFGTNSAPNGWGGSDYSGIAVYSPNNLIGGINQTGDISITNRNLISGNDNYGILIDNSAAGAHAYSNIVQGNFVGTDLTGAKRLPNQLHGILLNDSYGNLIGGAVNGVGNVISGNGESGLYLFNTSGSNTIQGNFIGTSADGTAAISNAWDGITVFGQPGPQNNLIGGTNTQSRNIVSGNGQRGIYIANPVSPINTPISQLTSQNVVEGNFFGLSSNGLAKIPNGYSGVELNEAWDNTIGGTNPAAGNIISGNNFSGITIGNVHASGNIVQNNLIGLTANGAAALGNAQEGILILGVSSNTVGPGNVISGNGFDGIFVTNGSAWVLIQGNYIGTDASGMVGIGNTNNGLNIQCPGSLVGGITPAAQNLISGNAYYGIYLTNTGASNNVIQGNLIGTDLTGANALGNVYAGIGIINAASNTVGGVVSAARNVISGNLLDGINIENPGASNNVVLGNFIGTDITGTQPVGNGGGTLLEKPGDDYPGIGINFAPRNLIGGGNSAARNIISGNDFSGIGILGLAATGNLIEGNYIGTDVSGATALANNTGSDVSAGTGGGVDVSGAPGNRIGGGASGPGNLISGNIVDAIAAGEAGASNTVIQGNWIGVASDGSTPLGNQYSGYEARSPGGANNTVIGGFNPGESNIIANGWSAGKSGIRIRAGNTNTLVRGNSIYNNGGTTGFGIYLGTALGAITPNYSGWPNYPVLASAVAMGSNTAISGTLGSAPNTSYLVQFYANAITNGNVQGQFFLGNTNVTTGANSNVSFTVTFPAAVPPGQVITATATDPNNNTSEFSLGAVVVAQVIPVLNVTMASGGDNGSSQITFTWATNVTGLSLVQTTNLAPPVAWTPLTAPATVNGTNDSVTISATNAGAFFKLTF